MIEQQLQTLKKPKRPFTGITPIYERLLLGCKDMPYGGIYHLHMLRAEQLCRLYYSPKSVKRVQSLLKDLVDNHYLQEEWSPTRQLRSKYIYVLGEQGIAYLKERDYNVSDSLRSSTEIGTSYSHITHLLELNDVLISAMLLQQHAPLYYLESLIHDRELKRNPCKVAWDGKKLDIIPDAFLDLRFILPDGKKQRDPILLELDRGSEFGEGFRKKVRGLIALVKSESYKERFKVGSITIAFATFQGEKRRDRMREVVRQELGGDLRALGQVFLFTNQMSPPEPLDMWLAPSWLTPDGQQPVSLLVE